MASCRVSVYVECRKNSSDEVERSHCKAKNSRNRPGGKGAHILKDEKSALSLTECYGLVIQAYLRG